MAFTRFTKNVLNVSALPDRVQNQAQALKATFDQSGVDIKAALNGLIAELEASTSASNLGADVSSVTTKTVQAILSAFEEEIANRYTKNEIDTLVSGNTNDLVADVDVNLTTGVITVTKKDGTVEKFDTAIEKVPAKFEIVESGTSLFLKITNVDGTSTQTDITELMNVYDFNNTNDIAFNVSGTGNEKVVTASIRPNSIGLDKLSLSVMTTLEGYMTSARDSAAAAKISEANAKSSANTATKAAEKASIAEGLANTAINKATEAESYAHGGTGTREGEDTDNAKYYSQVAKEVAGGDFVTPTEMEAYAQKKGTAPSFEGEELSGEIIETDVPLEMESVLHISGNSEQDSRSGKNLLKKGSDYVSQTSAGITFTVNDDESVTINGTNDGTGNSALYLYRDTVEGEEILIPAGTYKVPRTGNSNVKLLGYTGSSYPNIMNNSQDTFTLSSDTSFRQMYIQISKGVTETFNNYTIYPIMVANTDNLEPYEPYGAMPSPDYPSEIRSVKSKSDNLFDSDDALVTRAGFIKLEDGSYYKAQQEVIDTIWENSENIEGRMRIEGECKYDSASNSRVMYIRIHYTDGTITDTIKDASNFLQQWGKFAVISDSGKIVQKLSMPWGVGGKTYLRNIMLNKGTEALPYQPYYVPVEAKVEGKNLFDVNSVTYIVGKRLDDNGQAVTDDNACYTTSFCDVLPNVEYTISGLKATGGKQARIYYYTHDKNFIFREATFFNDFRFVTPYNCYYIQIQSSNDEDWATLQIEKGSTATPYVPYVEPTTISLPLGDIQLRSTPDGTRDTFERVDGVWNKVNNIGSEIFDGSDDEAWEATKYTTIDGGYVYFLGKNAFALKEIWEDDYKKSYCSSFTNVYAIWMNRNRTGEYSDHGSVRRKYFGFEFATLEEVKTWLATNPIQIDYILTTPTYTPITDTALIKALDELEQLILHKGYNRITVTSVNGVKAYLDLAIPPTASVTNVVETESSQDMIVPVVAGNGDVIPKIPVENQMTLNPATGVVKVNGKNVATEEYVDTHGVIILEASTENVIDFNMLTETGLYLIKNIANNTTVNASATNPCDGVLEVRKRYDADSKLTSIIQSLRTEGQHYFTREKNITSGSWSFWDFLISPSYISSGNLFGTVKAGGSVSNLNTSQIRNIKASTSDLTAGSSELASGDIYFVYE